MKQEDTKKKILEEALRLFSENGYDSVSVGEIANAVGIKAPSLYCHYAGKQAIFEAIIEEVSEKYEQYTNNVDIHMRESKKDVGLFSDIDEELLIHKVNQIFEFSLHDDTISRFRKMMTIEQFRTSQLSSLYTERYIDRMIEYHSAIFDALIKAGEISNENPEELALMYVSPIIILLGVCDREPWREEECVKKLEKHVKLFYHTFNIINRKSPDQNGG